MKAKQPEPELLPSDPRPHYQPDPLKMPDIKPITTQLAHMPQHEKALERYAPDPFGLMQSMIDKGVTSENAAAFKELVLLSEHMEDRRAKQSFAQAFIALQKEIPRIQATKVIPDRNGNMRSSFAPFEEIDTQCRPLCLKHGFTYSFSEGAFQQGKITKICTLQHEDGHERSNPYSVRIGQGPPGCSESQADGSAHSYAKRGALCDCLNIVVSGIDNDARLEGASITADQAEELERRVALLNQDHAKFLKWLGAKTYSEISSVKYAMADEFLRGKEQKR